MQSPTEADVAGLLGIFASSGVPRWVEQSQSRGINAPSFPGTERYNTESCEKGFKTKASKPPSSASLQKGAWGPQGMGKAQEQDGCGFPLGQGHDTKAVCSHFSVPSLSHVSPPPPPPAVVSPVCQIPRIYPKIFSSFCTYYLQVIIHH